MVLAMALLLLPAIQGKLFAQDFPSNENGQYPADQQGYDQQGYDQQGYGQPEYQQQPEAQQPYSEPPYSPDQAEPQAAPPQGYGQAQPLSAEELEQLVAPIALYPDSLIAQVLTASTYPEQVADADHWRRAQEYAPSEQIAADADQQPWDPSVKALTAFPRVLAQMDYNLQWATELGNAYYNQPQDLLQAVQVMRERAQAAGTLRSTPQEAVDYEQGNIVLAPVNPQLVYVPEYNPWAVYGQPVSPYPGFSLLDAVGSFIGSSLAPAAVQFGLGIATTAFLHTPFGLLAWGLDWLAHSVLFNGSDYYSHSGTVADWGLPHGGPRAFSRDGAWADRSYGANRSYGRTAAGYGRYGAGYSGSRSAGFSRTPYRTPNRDAYLGNRQAERYTRGYQTARNGYAGSNYARSTYARPNYGRSNYGRSNYAGSSYAGSTRGSYNNFRPVSRPQQYARSSYGSSFYNRPSESYGNRSGAGYGNSMRAPSSNFQHGSFGQHSSRGFSNKGFSNKGFAESGKQARSGGFHFGGGHEPKSHGGGHSFGHGHSGGGGHSGGHGHSGGGKHH
jgi:hypothetical protein